MGRRGERSVHGALYTAAGCSLTIECSCCVHSRAEAFVLDLRPLLHVTQHKQPGKALPGRAAAALWRGRCHSKCSPSARLCGFYWPLRALHVLPGFQLDQDINHLVSRTSISLRDSTEALRPAPPRSRAAGHLQRFDALQMGFGCSAWVPWVTYLSPQQTQLRFAYILLLSRLS